MKHSLRLRLFVIILTPLVILGAAVGGWRVAVALGTATDTLDRNLMFTALAVSRDISVLEGDAISNETERLLSQTAGGPVRYHVYGPDGALVTGYAVPPVPVTRRLPGDAAYAYYDATYKGDAVRVLRLKDEATVAGLAGTFTVTVWQHFDARNDFVWQLALRSLSIILTLLLAAAMLVWFGVREGLKPLTELEEAISRRSSQDLSPIRRSVPIETRGIVSRLNALLQQMGETMEAQSKFVSDAAHQLRNPIAGLRALGESILTSPNLDTARHRAGELVAAASDAGILANRLLALERASAESGSRALEPVDVRGLVEATAALGLGEAARRGVALNVRVPDQEVTVLGDKVMLGEAFGNLVDNAFVHGGTNLSAIDVSLHIDGHDCELLVSDDGRRVDPAEIPKILARFGQGETGQGSGLGLSIADAVARRHGGSLRIQEPDRGFAVSVRIPLCDPNGRSHRPA